MSLQCVFLWLKRSVHIINIYLFLLFTYFHYLSVSDFVCICIMGVGTERVVSAGSEHERSLVASASKGFCFFFFLLLFCGIVTTWLSTTVS